MEDEILLEFKRFSADKQEQIRQLVAYTTLMGLTGKDLVSIGGKLNRIQEKKERQRHLEIGLSYEVVPVGKSKKDQEANKGRKWYWTSPAGIKYRFDREYSYSVVVSNCETNKRTYQSINDLVPQLRTNFCANVMANLHEGNIKLP